jgi:Predicted membrane protein (DUF2207)
MAARGFLKIGEQDGSYTLTLTGKDDRVLTPDEKHMATILFSGRSQIRLHTLNQQTIHSALVALQKWLKAAEEKVYFVTNSRYLIVPVALSIVVVLAYLLLLGTPQVVGGVFMSLWLTFWTLGIAGLFRKVAQAWRSAFDSEKGQIISIGGGAVPNGIYHSFPVWRNHGLHVPGDVHFHFPGDFSSCRGRVAYSVYLSAEGADHSRPAHVGSGAGFQNVSWQSGRRSPESHRAAAADAGSFREVLAVRVGARRRTALGGTVLGRSRRCGNGSGPPSCVCAFLLFRLFVERIERHKLRIVIQQFVHQCDFFIVGSAGFQQRFWRWRIRRRWGRRRRRGLVEVSVWRCVGR